MPENNKREVVLTRGKDTKNKTVFEEAPAPGQPPVIDNLYLPKWLVGNAPAVKVTLEIG